MSPCIQWRMKRTLLPGRPYPLGATLLSNGTNFAIFSQDAVQVDLCFFDDSGKQTDSVTLRELTAHVWHGLVKDVKAGQLYGYRIDGSWEPEKGHLFNHNKLLVDPYAKAISGEVDWKAPIFAYDVSSGDDSKMDSRDSGDGVPRSVVIDTTFDWGDDCCPEIPLADSVLYEMHVKGFSERNPAIPEQLRGTYAGLAHDASIAYLKNLGVTAVELLPVHHFIDEGHLLDKGLVNYWGYNTLGYFSPMARYSSSGDVGGQVHEFKSMIKTLHRAGLEVILDVVYNHTCEGNHLGPMLSWKGICNRTYYRTVDDTPRYYMDYTGTGNTLNVRNPQVLKMIMDSLRYWVAEMHVDGFRFDLAATLARGLNDVSKLSSFFDTIHQDPTLADVKLIAEPWDVGDGGYQVGSFPVLWAEWNGKYRDDVRRFWKGDGGQVSALASRLTGSSDLYQLDGRKPYASVNFITAHDGFTMCDLVSYNSKHNEANKDDGRDGTDSNDSWNLGVEGPTDDATINYRRAKQVRNFLATLMFSQGVPMLCGGDEIARSQNGNNNCYCQDNELTWHMWDLDESRQKLLDFTSKLIRFRLKHANLHRRKFFQDREIRGKNGSEIVQDVAWFSTDGSQLSDETWNAERTRSLGFLLNGRTLEVTDDNGDPVVDDSFFIVVNAAQDGVEYKLPSSPCGRGWRSVLNTEDIDEPFSDEAVSESVIVGGQSLRILSDSAE